jgi:hypothetical protein
MVLRRIVVYRGVVPDVITLDQLGRDFTGLFRHRVFRLETLDFYDAPNEHEPYARFLAGEHVDPAWRKPWQGLVAGVLESGRFMQRVHVVSEPVTDYVRFSLLHGYPYSVQAGEDIRILGRARSGGMCSRGDWWLFDDTPAAVLVYDSSGTVERVEMHENPVLLAGLCKVRDEALRLAVPLTQYVSDKKIGRGKRHEHRVGRREVVQGVRQQ